ncbi:hypothetical protein BDW02DRAFT_325598 [Decorospora gaudefroyi]|uniref:Uncharacterized protein n=1 Tax=Decorospora gaudefroyi TaxID=184978 RepID=A0A6A5KA33_9PLEO|nr:hypothetical protein BDW02DRAFT_325598 [Decorospora gaudefroyi]
MLSHTHTSPLTPPYTIHRPAFHLPPIQNTYTMPHPSNKTPTSQQQRTTNAHTTNPTPKHNQTQTIRYYPESYLRTPLHALPSSKNKKGEMGRRGEAWVPIVEVVGGEVVESVEGVVESEEEDRRGGVGED